MIAYRWVLTCLLSAGTCHAQGIITTAAGTDIVYPGTSFSALSESFGVLAGVAVNPINGNIYFSASARSLVLKFNPQLNSVSVVAGVGLGGYSGDGGPAINAALDFPHQIAFDGVGNLYIADSNNGCIRKVDTSGVITTYAKVPNGPAGLAFGPDGTLYASGGSTIYTITATGTRKLFAGNPAVFGFAGDGGPAASALLNQPGAMAFDKAGNLYITEFGNNRVRKINSNGIISTFAGNGRTANPVTGPALSASLGFLAGVGADPSGNVYIGSNNCLSKVSPDGQLTVLNACTGNFPVSAPTPVANANVGAVSIAFDAQGNMYFPDGLTDGLFRLSSAGIVQLLAAYNPDFGLGDNGPAVYSNLSGPGLLSIAPDGSLLISEAVARRVRRVTTTGNISTLAVTLSTAAPRNGSPVILDGGPPNQTIQDAAGNLYVSTIFQVQKISSSGIASTILQTNNATGIALDLQGNLLVADLQTNTVTKVSPGGQTTTFAGNGQSGFSGDGGPAVSASLNVPIGLAVDLQGNVYIADNGNNRIRKVDTTGKISTVAGGGSQFNISGIPATSAALSRPLAVAVDRAGNVYASTFNQVAKISNGTFSVMAGVPAPGFSGDGGPANQAMLNNVQGLAVDASGNVFIADQNNNRIREILAAPPTLSVSNTAVNVSAISFGPQVFANLNVGSNIPGLAYTVSFATKTGGDWLGVSFLMGQAPGTLQILADPSGLASGTYTGTVTINCPYSSPQSLTISVTLNVGVAQAAKLSLSALSLSFAQTAGGSSSTTQLTVSNNGSGTIGFQASAETVTGGSWLSVSQNNGNVTAGNPAGLSVTANPTGLAVGSYNGSVTVASSNTGEQITLPVSLAVNPAPNNILLSQTGLTFTAVAQGGAPIPQSVGILNIGAGSMNWSASASTLSGGNWLSVAPPGGTVTRPFLDVSFTNVSVDASSLAAGTYYGSVQVTAPNASNSPQTVLIVLQVLPAGSNPGPQLSTTGLVFTSPAGNVNPGAQTVSVANVTSKPIQFGSSIAYVGNTVNWIAYLPQNGNITPSQPAQVIVQPNFTTLTPGVLRSVLTLAFDDGSARTVSILSVVAPAGTTQLPANSERPYDVAGCAPTALSPVFTQVGTATSVSTGWPVGINVKVVDDCGNPQTKGSVVASFSNGDAPLALVSLQNGTWSGTWQPRNAGVGAVQISIAAKEANLSGGAQTTIGLSGVQTPPVITDAPVNAATKVAGALAPGELFVVTGNSLANGQESSTTAPVPLQLAGAALSIGGQLTPLLYASNGQLAGIVPKGLAANSSLQIVPLRDNAAGVPMKAVIAPTQPAVFAQDGSGKGQALVYKTGVLADKSNPVQPGDTVIIYCAGLGVVDASGAVTNPVGLTVGGQSAQVSYAGAAIASSFPASGPPSILGVSTALGGLYQITATIPNAVASGPAPILITSAGQTSQQGVTLAIGGSSTGTVPVINAAVSVDGRTAISQNDFIAVYGTNLAPASVASGMPWDKAPEFQQGRMPTQLGGVTATVNGQSAFVQYVSGTQVNLLSPLDSNIGPVQVVITHDAQSSQPFTVTEQNAAPTFLNFPGTSYVAARHADYGFLGPPKLYPGASTPAKPNETVLLYAVGFGPPSTALINGSSNQVSPLPVLPVVKIGGRQANVAYAGVAGPGLYQLNVQIPADAVAGDNAVVATYNGVSTQSGVLISVQP